MDKQQKNKTVTPKSTVIVAGVVVLLAAVVVVFAILNRGRVDERKKMEIDGVFNIKYGDTVEEVSMQDLENIGLRDVEANYKKSGKEPETRVYTGVPFADILAAKNIDATSDNYLSVIFTAMDGYASAVPLEQALAPGECWIVVKENGEPLGTKASGGSGPFRMILPNDQFSQNWCSFLMDAELRA